MLQMYVRSPDIDKGAISHLFDNLDLIVSHKQTIMTRKEYRNIAIPGIFAGGMYVGMHIMSLGDILDLWETTEWRAGTRYYLNIIGSPLSGSNHSWWYDTQEKKFGSGTYFNGKYFFGLAEPALRYLKNHPKQGEPSDLTIFDLVQRLQQQPENPTPTDCGA